MDVKQSYSVRESLPRNWPEFAQDFLLAMPYGNIEYGDEIQQLEDGRVILRKHKDIFSLNFRKL